LIRLFCVSDWEKAVLNNVSFQQKVVQYRLGNEYVKVSQSKMNDTNPSESYL